MRDKGAWSEVSYRSRAVRVASEGRGVSTYEGEQRVRQGKGLDPLVDPKGLPKYGPVRGSNNLLVPDEKIFVLKFGVAMPVQTDIDTTGSMAGNVDIAFRVQPKVQNLLIQGKNAVLKRYQAQMCTGVIQDRMDRYPYQRSQFEPDNQVEVQMGLFDPQRAGGDAPEEYQLGLFAAAYLTDASITKYGLRGYYFQVGDEVGRETLERDLVERVFGDSVYSRVTEKISLQNPSTDSIGKKLLEKWHGFFLQVDSEPITKKWWGNVIGKERVIKLPRTEDLAEVQAVIIGLTEGVFDLQGAKEFLREVGVDSAYAKRIVDACSDIPIGVQKTFENFDKIPMAGAKFASRDDIWPIDEKLSGKKTTTKSSTDKPATKKKSWKL